MADAEDFAYELGRILGIGEGQGLPYVDVTAGDIHRKVGEYPGKDHRMPICCHVMRKYMLAKDATVAAPPKGDGASLKIRYRLPRP